MDHISDKNCSMLYKIAKTVKVPDFVNDHEVMTEKEASVLKKECFADETNKQYPITSEADTWLSVAYYSKYASARDPEVEDKLTKAVDFWGIIDSVRDLRDNTHELLDKKASNTKNSRIKIQYTYNDEVKAETSVGDFNELEKVAGDIVTNYAKYPYEMRKNVCRQVISANKQLKGEFSEEISDILYKTAGYAVADKCTVLDIINEKKYEHGGYGEIGEKFDDAYCVIDKMAGESEYVEPELVEKVASMLDRIDRFVGVHKKYGYIPPERELYTVTRGNVDNFKNNNVVLFGNTLTKSALEKKSEDLQQLYNDVFDIKAVSFQDVLDNLDKLTEKEAHFVSKIVNEV